MNILERELMTLEEEIKNTRSYLRNHRAPRIHKNRSEEGMKLLLVNEENGKLKRETIQFSDKRAKAFFVQKIYKIRERRLKKNIEFIKKLKKDYEDISFEKIFEQLETEYEIEDRGYLVEALNECEGTKHYEFILEKDYGNVNFRESGKIHTSSTGQKYRSKSELLIESQLRKHKVNFEYECKLICGPKIYRPDFTIMRNDGSIVIWEHFGMINDKGYVEEMVAKYNNYVHYGIVPWDNLVMTFDKKNGGLNVEEVEFIIEHQILV